MPATARMPARVWMQATELTQATTVAPATSNSKDDMVWMPAKAGMLLKSEMAAAAGTMASSWTPSAVGLLE